VDVEFWQLVTDDWRVFFFFSGPIYWSVAIQELAKKKDVLLFILQRASRNIDGQVDLKWLLLRLTWDLFLFLHDRTLLPFYFALNRMHALCLFNYLTWSATFFSTEFDVAGFLSVLQSCPPAGLSKMFDILLYWYNADSSAAHPGHDKRSKRS